MTTQNSKNEIDREKLLAKLSVQSMDGDKRIENIALYGKSYWIKRLHIEDVTTAKRLHNFATKFVKNTFLASTPLGTPKEVTEREIRKYSQFSKAGIAVPEIVWSSDTMLLIQDASPTVADLMRVEKKVSNFEKVDEYLAEFGFALSRAHKANLCHGRPHTRDAVMIDGELGFIDFEEEPEISMPMEMAQARDFWLAMLHICENASSEKTPEKIFEYWTNNVSQSAIDALSDFNKFFLPLLKIARKVPERFRGSDLKRGMLATSFIDKSIADLRK